MKSAFDKLFAAALLLLIISPVASAQEPPIPSALGATMRNGTGWIMVYIRGEDGKPLSGLPTITVTCETNSTPIAQTPRVTGNGWVFSGLATGTSYQVEVRMDGFRPAIQSVLIPDMDYGMANVIVFMKLAGSSFAFHPPAGHFLLAPRAQKEVDKGLKDLNSGKIPSAQKHFLKAVKMAPGNPYVNYVTGMSYLLAKQVANAQPYLEESVSVDPTQVPSLLALGTLRFDQSDYAAAVEVLSRAVKMDPTSLKSQWVLAASYLREKNYAQARDHAQAALKVSKGQATQLELLLGEALAGLGDRQGAASALQSFLASNPKDPNAPRIRRWIQNLKEAPPPVNKPQIKDIVQRSGPTAELAATAQPAVTAPVPEVPPKNWAPADVDAVKPFVISGASCSLPKVLQLAGRNAIRFTRSLQEFTSTEEYESVEIKRNENLKRPGSHTDGYMAFIERPNPAIIHVTEYRQDDGANAPSGELEDVGAPALALVFHPLFQNDFSWSCEGLGQWRNGAAWIVRFEQRANRPDRLASFESPSEGYALPLKGLAWVLGESGQVVHLEADLVKPIAPIDLKREHVVIDYQPVTFKTHKITLWLPENVDVYYQYRGHFLHHYHHFSNFKLFWTGSTQKVSLPP